MYAWIATSSFTYSYNKLGVDFWKINTWSEGAKKEVLLVAPTLLSQRRGFEVCYGNISSYGLRCTRVILYTDIQAFA